MESVPDGSVVCMTEGTYTVERPLILSGRITLRAVSGQGVSSFFATDVCHQAKRNPYAFSDAPSVSALDFAWEEGATSAGATFSFEGEQGWGGDPDAQAEAEMEVDVVSPRTAVGEADSDTDCSSLWEREGGGVILRASEHGPVPPTCPPCPPTHTLTPTLPRTYPVDRALRYRSIHQWTSHFPLTSEFMPDS